MNEAKLILDIGADVSQFNKSLADVREGIKSVLKQIESASGAELGELNLKLTGLERTQDELVRFGSFADGTIGSIINQLARLKQEKLELKEGDTSGLESYNKKIQELTSKLKGLNNVGLQKIETVVDPVVINSIEYFNQQINELQRQNKRVAIDTSEGREQMALLNNSIEYYKDRIKEAQSLGKGINPVSAAAINSIEYFNQQINILAAKRDSISIDTVDARAEIASLNNEIEDYKRKISGVQNIGKSVDFIDLNTIKGIRARLAELENIKINIQLNNEGELAAVNSEIATLTKQLNDLDQVSIDKNGAITKGAAKARQAFTNLGLVIQDLPFGFIAIQNNIPNLLQGLVSLQQEAKLLGVTTGSLLVSQLSGVTGQMIALGLAISIATSAVTYAVQKYGSLSAAIKEWLGYSFKLSEKVRENAIEMEKFNKKLLENQSIISRGAASTSGEIGRVQALISIINDATSSYDEIATAKRSLEEIDNDYFSRLSDEGDKYNELSSFITDYVNSLKQAAITKSFQDQITNTSTRLSEQQDILAELEEAYRLERNKPIKTRGKSETPDTRALDAARAAFQAQEVVVGKLEEKIKKYNEGLSNSVNIQNNIQVSINKVRDANQKLQEDERKRIANLKKLEKLKFDFDIPKLEEFLDVENFYDPRKALSRLEDYADVVLDVREKESERASVLSTLSKEAAKTTNGNFKLFESLKIGKSSTDDIKKAIVEYGYELQRLAIDLTNAEKLSKVKFKFELPKLDVFLRDVEEFYKFEEALSRLDKYGQILFDPKSSLEDRIEVLKKLQTEQVAVFNQDANYFNNLQIGVSTVQDLTNAFTAYANALQQALVDKKSISNLFDSKEIKSQFDSLKELAKGLPSELLPNFKDFEKEITDVFTLEFLKKGQPLDIEALKVKVQTALDGLKGVIEKAQIQNALAKIFGGDSDTLKAKDKIDSIVDTITTFRETIADNLEKPFRDFFDNLIENGKVSLKSFADLFKDVLKRIASQLLASGIAKLITSILFPQSAVTGAVTSAVTGGASGAAGSGILKFLGKLLGISKPGEANFGGIGTGGMQLAGQVVFTQRGSDLVGVLNRTNGTINRVG